MSAKYWPPASLVSEGNTSDIGDKLYPDQPGPTVQVWNRFGELIYVGHHEIEPGDKISLDTFRRMGYTVVVTPRVGA